MNTSAGRFLKRERAKKNKDMRSERGGNSEREIFWEESQEEDFTENEEKGDTPTDPPGGESKGRENLK